MYTHVVSSTIPLSYTTGTTGAICLYTCEISTTVFSRGSGL